MKRILGLFIIAWLIVAQSQQLQLSLRRDFGYGNGDQIQGAFTLAASGPADLTQVTFKIDDQVVGTATQAPFQVSFDTGSYALGRHSLSAVGQTASGQTLTSAPQAYEFVSAGQVQQGVLQAALPILGVVAVIFVVAIGVAVLDVRRSRASPTPLGAQRHYGLMGGAICPKCGRPFSRHWWAPNAGLGKFDRCPHCGKWSIVRAQPLDQLRAAEAAELKETQATLPGQELSPEEKLRRQIDESRYDSR